jgi:capsular polysaccharide biosynthesis protein/Mrp family chromosome partitioning ATPase
MATSGGTDSFELGDYLGMLRRRWLIVVALTCVGIVLAGAYYKTARKTYTATAAVYVNATATNNAALGRTGGSVNMDNEAQIAQSQAVAVVAANRLHSTLPLQQLLKQISVTVPPNTTVLDISCKTRPRAEAQACANDFAAAYLYVRLSATADTVSSAVSALEVKGRALTSQISKLRSQTAGLPASSPRRTTVNLEVGAANSQLAAVDSQINQLVPELSSLRAQGNALAGRVITPAVLPTSASSPRALLLLPSGLLAGLLIGLIVAFIAERRDDRIHTARDVQRFFDLPVLLTVSARKTKSRTTLAVPWSRADREFAELARHVAASLGNGKHVLLIAGTTAGTGGSAVAANLAVMLARTGAGVALICTDPRSVTPRLLGIDGTRGGRGLAEVLAGTTSAAEIALSPPGTTRLRVITAGATTAVLPGVEHDVVSALLADLKLDSRFVIIEASAVGDAPGAFTLAEFADAAIVAIEENATRRSDVEECLLRLDRLGTVALGAAVVPATGAAAADQLRPRTDAETSGRARPVARSARRSEFAGGQRQASPNDSDAGPPETPVRSDRAPDKDPADSAAGS